MSKEEIITLDQVYASELWKDIQDNFAAFDDLIEDSDLRDFYKRVIWEMVHSRITALESELAGYKKALEEIKGDMMQCKMALCKTVGILDNIRHETDYMPDSYYEWIDRVRREIDEFLPNEEDFNALNPRP